MTKEHENSTTELLCNLFRIKYFRDICLELFGIEKKFIDDITLENISTQYHTDNSGIPDIVIRTDNFLCFIENKIKIDTPLQENQKKEYPKNLLEFKGNNPEKHIHYIFLIPKDYKHEDKIIINEDYKKFTKIYYWQEFLSDLKSKELDIYSPIIKEGLTYFKELLQEVEPPDTVLTAREVLIMDNPRKIFDLLNLLVKIRETIKDSLKIVADKMGKDYSLVKECYDQWAQGWTFNYKNNYIPSIFVGITPNLYDNENGVFYSVALVKKHMKENIVIDENKFKHFKDDEWVYIAIDKDLFVEDNKEKILADKIIDILENIFEKYYKG